jgi:hypothetical protein
MLALVPDLTKCVLCNPISSTPYHHNLKLSWAAPLSWKQFSSPHGPIGAFIAVSESEGSMVYFPHKISDSFSEAALNVKHLYEKPQHRFTSNSSGAISSFIPVHMVS